MSRVLCVTLPWFRTERLTRSLDAASTAFTGPEPELAVVLRRSNTLILTGVTRSAWRAGVREGMTLANARAMLPKLEVAYQNDEAEARTLESLAAFAYSFTPDVRLWRPNVLMLDIAGVERLHGSEEALIGKVSGGLSRLGFTSHMAGCCRCCATADARSWLRPCPATATRFSMTCLFRPCASTRALTTT